MDLIEPWWCYNVHYLFTTLTVMCHSLAIWLTVLLAAQRLIYIKYPLSAGRYCTIRNVNIATAVITIVCFLYVLPKLAFEVDNFNVIKYKVMNGTEFVTSFYACTINYHPFVRSIGEGTYFSAVFWIRVALFVFIPCVLLIILSIMLIAGLRKAQIRRKRLMERRRSETHRESSTTSMLAVVTVIFLVVNLPQGVCLGLFSIWMTTGLYIMDNDTFTLINIVDNLLILVTFPINFAIYCSMSTQFRTTFKALFVRSELMNVARRMGSTASTPMVSHRQHSVAAANGHLHLPVDGHGADGPSREEDDFSHSPAISQTASLLMNTKL